MRIHFNIPFFTRWGQRLLVTGNIPELGDNDKTKALPLNFQHKEDWSGEIEIPNTESFELTYKYILFNDETGQFVDEWGDDRVINIQPSKTDTVYCFDKWNAAGSTENVFLTAPFQQVLLKQQLSESNLKQADIYTHLFKVKMPVLKNNEAICLIGDCRALGNWTTSKPVILNRKKDNWWTAEVDLSNEKSDVHYKYGVYDLEDHQFRYFEAGADRTAPIAKSKKGLVILSDGFTRFPNHSWKGAGVGLPVFSIRTRESFGVGDFGDIKLLVDWAARVGLKLIQVLPLNDTIGTHTDADVLPYAAISAFALNPLFLNLPSMGKLAENHPLQAEYSTKQAELNAKELIAFMDVISYKLRYAKQLYLQSKESFLADQGFKTFFAENEYWLIPYAAYCVLRDKFGTPDYREWQEFAHYDRTKIAEFASATQPHFDDIAVNYFIQYHLHKQLSEAAAYAHKHGVVLKGDIPIGVNRNSVDTWVSPELFHMYMQAGAPPDMFAIKGQNWELPTYNWKEIEHTGFDWWKKRFSQMSNYFDTFRIDHILGFFRIWQIPVSQVEGIMGYLNPSIPIHINEFAEKGLWFDYNRFCKPYITDFILWDLFGEDVPWVKANCLQIEDGWVLRLKENFLSQLTVEKLHQAGEISDRIKWGLFDLISNVLFFEVEGSNGTQFYPRFGMESLSTFRDLDYYTQERLRELYVDYFYRRQDDNWYKSGMEKLPALKRATNMLICGEDLGMMTPCVTTAMKELGILSLEVQRAPKSNEIEFFHPDDAPYLSVVTPSTHDMSTIRGWWEEDRGVTQRFYNSQLGHWGEAPYFCEWWICRDIILQHLYSPAIWSIFLMQDLLSISDSVRRPNPNDERINVPSNSMNSWRFRLHLNMEDLLENDEFNDELLNYITQAGR